MTWRAGERLMGQIHHFAAFPQTSVSLQQMVQFGMVVEGNHMLISQDRNLRLGRY
jgi:hypothetical protein